MQQVLAPDTGLPVLPAGPAPAAELPAPPPLELPPPALPPTLPTLRSQDGRLTLTDTHLTVLGEPYNWRELERAEVAHVRWVLWVLLGALGLAGVLIAFLQNWLHTLPAAAGMALTALLLAYGQRGTNRLRLWRLGRQPAHYALPGELAGWQRLVGEANRRITRAHDRAAAEAAALLAEAAALAAARLAAAEAAASAEAETATGTAAPDKLPFPAPPA